MLNFTAVVNSKKLNAIVLKRNSNHSLRAALLAGLPLTAADDAVTVIVCAPEIVEPDAFVSVIVDGF